MFSFTEKELKNAFIRLLNKKSVKKITVKEIVEECGVNRNTFYYHFEDIPQLLEQIIKENVEQIASQYSQIDNIEDCLKSMVDFALANKNLIANIYSSANRDLFELYEWKLCEQLAQLCIDKALQNRTLSKIYYDAIFTDIKCVSFGFIMNWLENGMSESIYDDIHLLCQLKDRSIERMIKHSSQI